MRTIQTGLAAHLADGVTTLCRCWTLTRTDGLVLGFTDHDQDITLDGVIHRARSGLEASEASAELGFAVAGMDVAGVLHAAGLSEADIRRGLYDGATVRISLASWSNPADRHVLDLMVIGEIRRGDSAFVAELRGAAHRFDEERGRLYTRRCSADLGDSRCGKAVSAALSTVAATDGAGMVTLPGLAAFASGWFSGGRLSFASGANSGHQVEIRQHDLIDGLAVLQLWLDVPMPIVVGDAVSVKPGCDKSFATCRSKFGNSVNFQGFPHIPGTELLLQVAGQTGAPVADGGSLFR